MIAVSVSLISFDVALILVLSSSVTVLSSLIYPLTSSMIWLAIPAAVPPHTSPFPAIPAVLIW